MRDDVWRNDELEDGSWLDGNLNAGLVAMADAMNRAVDPMDHLEGLGAALEADQRVPYPAEVAADVLREASAVATAMGIDFKIEDSLNEKGHLITRIRMITRRGETTVQVKREGGDWPETWRRAFRDLGLLD